MNTDNTYQSIFNTLKERNNVFFDHDIYGHNNDDFSIKFEGGVLSLIDKHKLSSIYLDYKLEHESQHISDIIASNEYDSLVEFNEVLKERNCYLNIIYCASKNTKAYQKIKNLNLSNFNLILWETALLYDTYEMVLRDDDTHSEEYKSPSNFNKLYWHFNNINKLHRSMMMDYLEKYDLIKLGDNSWMNRDIVHTPFDLELAKNNFTYKYDFKYWNPTNLKVDDFNGNGEFRTRYIFEPNGFIHLIGETNYEVLVYTEKTWRSILLAQPFISYGAKNQNKQLENYGFKLYDEIIDYSFDSLDSLEDRISAIAKCLYDIKNRDYIEMYNLIKPKLDYNKKRALDIINSNEFIPSELLKTLTKL